jgi:hypothetical protein
MRGFWLPIGIRAAVIFIFGMLLVGGARYVKRHTHFAAPHAPVEMADAEAQARENAVQAAENAAQATVNAKLSAKLATRAGQNLGALSGLAGLTRSKSVPPDFIVDGARVGSLVHFNGSRGATDAPARFALVVRLDPGRKPVTCDLAPAQPDDFDLDRGFRCAAPGEQGLEKLGSVTFQPTGGTRAVLGSARMARDLAKGEPFSMDADLGGPMNLVVNGKDGERVRLRSDSQNTALVVRDEQGKEVVRMQAGKNGFSITVDTTGH